jgi:hypothetical protein
VLENHHIATAFKLMKNSTMNIFDNLKINDYKRTRERIVNMVLETDMTKHFADIAKFNSRTSSDGFDPAGEDKMISSCLAIHVADISNPGKPWEICKKWTE